MCAWCLLKRRDFAVLKQTPVVQRGKWFSVGQSGRETVLLWNISVHELGCRPPPGEGEPGSAHCSGKISMGTPLALPGLLTGLNWCDLMVQHCTSPCQASVLARTRRKERMHQYTPVSVGDGNGEKQNTRSLRLGDKDLGETVGETRQFAHGALLNGK